MGHKALMCLLGFILFLVLLESGLRAGGFIILSYQDHRNKVSLKQQGAYRILCLGESTTQNQYPPVLEQMLNRNNRNIKFSVIDQGRAATNTSVILLHLESYLNVYRPDMVVVMMGINDRGVHIAYEKPSNFRIVLFLRSLRTYKLARLLGSRITSRTRERQPGLAHARLEEGCASLEDGIRKEEALRKTIRLNPGNDKAYAELGRIYYDVGYFKKAYDAFKKAIESNPGNDAAYVGLGWVYHDLWQTRNDEACFKKAIEVNPGNDAAYVGLGWLYHERGQFDKSEEFLKKAIALNPGNDKAYFELGSLYYTFERPEKAEKLFQKAIELNARNDMAYAMLGRLYYRKGLVPQAAACFKNALEADVGNKSQFYAALGTLYAEMKRFPSAQESYNNANRLRLNSYNSATADNFLRLKEILDSRNIKLVCVQYPMLSVEPLKRIFKEDGEGILFVDNEQTFKNGVIKAGYRSYFTDMFSGDFGHCTDKGNQLLAENIARIICSAVHIESTFAPSADGAGRRNEFKKDVSADHGIDKNYGAYLETGWLFYEHGNLSQAEELFQKARELDPGNEGANLGLGRIYIDKQEPSRAEAYIKAAAEADPENDRIFLDLGHIYYAKKDFLQAQYYLNKAILLNSRNDGAYILHGLICCEQGRQQQAQRYFKIAEGLLKTAIEIDPRDFNAYIGVGVLSVAHGDFVRAVDCFLKALQINPRMQAASRGLGSSLEKLMNDL